MIDYGKWSLVSVPCMCPVTDLLHDTPIYVGCFVMPGIPRVETRFTFASSLPSHLFLDDISNLVYAILSDEVRW
jgi:hypothetical protein